MKARFSCSLTGSLWWKPYLLLLAASVAIIVPMEIALFKMQQRGQSPELALSAFLFVIVMAILATVVGAAISMVLARIMAPTVALGSARFSFDGKPGEYAKMNLSGILLSILTLGFYGPWYYRNVIAYCVSHTEYAGTRGKFEGKAGKYLKYILLGLGIPLFIWFIVLSALVAGIMMTSGEAGLDMSSLMMVTLVSYAFLFLLMAPFIYLTYKWFVNISWNNGVISLEARFFPSVFYIIGQILLCFVTFGIYLPAMYVNMWRYFVGKATYEENGAKAEFGFDGKTGKGFALLWGQFLLTIVTVGIYSPWAVARCTRFFVENTFVETNGNDSLVAGS